MNKEKRILTFQDMSCVGQCSLGVALPIISACGHETCPLPSAILSTHTGGEFSGYTFNDLSDSIMPVVEHWKRQGIYFDAFYSGYLGNGTDIKCAKHIMGNLLCDGAVRIVDPAMADNGSLYPGFDSEYARAMTELCTHADIIIPNVTEACIMAGIDCFHAHTREKIISLLDSLSSAGMKKIILTGVSLGENSLGVAIYDNGQTDFYLHEKINVMCHGTGDIYASAFVGAYLRGISFCDSARIAADFTLESIKLTYDRTEHWYGARFEKAIPYLITLISTATYQNR